MKMISVFGIATLSFETFESSSALSGQKMRNKKCILRSQLGHLKKSSQLGTNFKSGVNSGLNINTTCITVIITSCLK